MTSATWNVALPSRWPWRRLLVAIAVSVLVHVLIANNWRSSGGASQVAAVLPQLQARLDTPAEPLVVAVAERLELPSELARPRPLARLPPLADRATPPAVAATGSSSAAGEDLAVPDNRFYLARELDRYPVPLAPLSLRPVAGRSGSVRLWLSIDLAGNVVDVSVVNADPSGELETLAREYLLATRFVPAVKDGRPVKSRVLLELLYVH